MTCIPSRRRVEILILDDEQLLAEMLGELLKTKGYAATLCRTGAEAIELLERCDFDLVVSDLRMPEMSGREFYQLAILKKPELTGRILFITGDVLGEENQSFLESTGNPHLSKPFKPAVVEKVIAEMLRGTVSV